MYDINTILALINGRNGLCSVYEETMDSLITCDEEELLSGVDKLVELSKSIEDINSRLNHLAAEDLDNEVDIWCAVYNQGSRAGLSEDLLDVYDTAQEGFICLNRASNASLIVKDRLANCRQKLDKKIRSLSINPKIISYLYSGASTESAGGMVESNV